MHFLKMKCIKTMLTPNSPHFAPQGIYAPSNSCCKIVNQPHPPRPPRLEKITDIHTSALQYVSRAHTSQGRTAAGRSDRRRLWAASADKYTLLSLYFFLSEIRSSIQSRFKAATKHTCIIIATIKYSLPRGLKS